MPSQPSTSRVPVLPAPYYEDDAVTIYHGDCRDVLVGLDCAPEAVITDPPFAISVKGSTHVNRPGKGSRNLDFFEGDDDWPAAVRLAVDGVLAAARLVPTGGSIYALCGHRQFGPIVQALEAESWTTRPVVWAKKCPTPGPPGSGWPSGLEMCVYGYRAGRKWTHRPGEGPKSNVLVFDSYRHGQPGKVDHPTQMPLGFASTLIQTCTEHGDLIVDPFMGSGTTLFASKGLGRRAIGIETEERYCELAALRLGQEVLAV
jgi:site-specific DNA-methyltransferase (adenine-specific)